MNQSIVLEGLWQDGQSSRSQPARVVFSQSLATLEVEGATVLSALTSELSISAKIGETPRQIRFPDHPGQLECRDIEASDWLDRQIGHHGSRLLARIEANLLFALGSAGIIALLSIAYFIWGIPSAAQLIAQNMPENTLSTASAETFKQLNEHLLGPSELALERQQALRDLIQHHIPDYNQQKLHFAASEVLGANALALPDGTVIGVLPRFYGRFESA